jgi:4-hydroxymandelate oxidase
VNPLLADHAARAAAVLRPEVHAYYATGAGDGVTAAEAAAAWTELRLRPRVLRDVSAVDTATHVLGDRLAAPLVVAPSALHGLAHDAAEAETARGAAAAGSLTVVSTRASRRLEEIPAGPWWFQAYVMKDRGLTRGLVQRAAGAGASAIVLTGDTPYLGRRSGLGRNALAGDPLINLVGASAASIEQDPSAGLEAIEELAGASGLPVLVKGVLRGDDAVRCLDAGAAGIVVSNHGGRQLDRAIPTARALPEVADAVAGRAPVLVDGGLTSGLDVLCALALGADAVLLGRPVLWALAVGGAAGVQECLEALTDELAHVMGLAGASSLAEVGRDLVVRP